MNDYQTHQENLMTEQAGGFVQHEHEWSDWVTGMVAEHRYCLCDEAEARPTVGPTVTVYGLFIAEMEALTIKATDPVVYVVGLLTRAVKRAQMVHDGELASVSERSRTGRPS